MDPPLPQHKWIFFLSAFVYSCHHNNTMHSISRRSKTNFIFIPIKSNKLRLERFVISSSSQLFSFVSIRLSVQSGKWWRWYLLCEVKVVCSLGLLLSDISICIDLEDKFQSHQMKLRQQHSLDWGIEKLRREELFQLKHCISGILIQTPQIKATNG